MREVRLTEKVIEMVIWGCIKQGRIRHINKVESGRIGSNQGESEGNRPKTQRSRLGSKHFKRSNQRNRLPSL